MILPNQELHSSLWVDIHIDVGVEVAVDTDWYFGC